jgi:hypothetical protein
MKKPCEESADHRGEADPTDGQAIAEERVQRRSIAGAQ